VARYGGEEFALLLADCSFAEAIVVAERLRLGVSGGRLPHVNRGDGLSHVTVSLGVAVSSSRTASAAALVEAADMALYEAKARGRDQTYPLPAYFLGGGEEEPGEVLPPAPLCA
jgi:diguanylate cyclase (GGDEF)-like protein